MAGVLVIGITSRLQTFHIGRGDGLALKEREFALAAHGVGTPPGRVIHRHTLPNVMSPSMGSATLGITDAIITDSALRFLGLGFPSDCPTRGCLLYDGANSMTLTPSGVIGLGLLSRSRC